MKNVQKCMLFCVCISLVHTLDTDENQIYTNSWAVEISGGPEIAESVAEKHGFAFIGHVFGDIYHMEHHGVSKRSTDHSHHQHSNLVQESSVKWIEQQIVKRRVKRDFRDDHRDSFTYRDRRQSTNFNDPKWPRMWYLNRGNDLDMSTQKAWQAGYTGKGVVVTILDDGIEKDHPDLKKNYDPDASYDVNAHDKDPQPRYDYTNENRHGTRCAGEVAAEANNGICSVGAAYDASIGGVRMLDGDVTDLVEATSLSLKPQHIDIYSASWGPDDDGKTVDGPAILARKAFADGIDKGRKGKGSIFVWASGNGGRESDNCNCDGYTNSIYTLSISSATENGRMPWYSEACSSTLATTYSSGSGQEKQIVTTDLRKACTEQHTGTSASAPLAAGVCALALEANPHLTWRDMQHIVVKTARPDHLQSSDWVTNGVGRKVSHSFGFGLMDAYMMTQLARNWSTVPEQHKCEIKYNKPARSIPANSNIKVSLMSNGCQGSKKVLYLEHVQAVISLSSSRRGQIAIYLTSPSNTRSTLLAKRSHDSSTEGFNQWAFMTTHNWGEFSQGEWTLEIDNGASSATLKDWSLVMYGTATDPQRSSKQNPGGYIDCKDEYELNNRCVPECPHLFYGANITNAPNDNGTTTNLLPAKTESANQTTANNEPTNQTTSYKLLCLPCYQGCQECTGPKFDQCLSCSNGFKLKNNTCTANFKIWDFVNKHGNVAIFSVIITIILVCGMFFWIIFAALQYCDSQPIMICCPKEKYPWLSRDEPSVSLQNGISKSYLGNYEKVNLLDETDTDDEVFSMEKSNSKGAANGIGSP